MKPFDVPFLLFAFLGFVAVTPVWMWFTSQHPAISQMQIEARFMIQFTLPASLLLFLAGWFDPGGGR